MYYVRRHELFEYLNPPIDKDIFFPNDPSIEDRRDLIFFNSQNVGSFEYEDFVITGKNHVKNRELIIISIPMYKEKYWKIHQDEESFLLMIPKTPTIIKDLIHPNFIFLPFIRGTLDFDNFDRWYSLYQCGRIAWTDKKEKVIKYLENEYKEYCQYLLNNQKLNVKELEIFINFDIYTLSFTIECELP